MLVDRLSYAYDPAGNTTSIVDEMPGVPVDRQCFRYDNPAAPDGSMEPDGRVCGRPQHRRRRRPGPYWQSLRYDVTGNRTPR